MKKVTVLGFGIMGQAIAKALNDNYKIVGLDQGDDYNELKDADFIILAIKPQVFHEIADQINRFIDRQTVLSVMAGIKCAKLNEKLGGHSVVRTMPNLGVATGKSVTAAFKSGQINKAEVSALLGLWGEIIWLEEESDFDGFTAIAGCGPAYYFELTSQLEIAAKHLGFQPALARQIANATLGSAASMLDSTSAADKVEQVASKGGVTEAALKVLENHDFSQIIQEAVNAAQTKSRELSQ